MKIGVALSVPAAAENAVDAVVDQARAVEAAGIGSIWLGQRFDYDSVALAGIVGREVTGLDVGTSALPVFGRHPLLVGAQAQTTQAATRGRFTLGLGLGAKAFVEPVFGIPHDRPIARLRTMLADGAVDFHGETLTAVSPMPTGLAGAAPAVPVLVAAMGPQALRVTGELADGTLPFLAGPKALAEHVVPRLLSAAEAAGRPAPRVVALVAGVVTDDVEAAREEAARQTAFYDRIPSYQKAIELSGASLVADLVEVGDEKAIAAAVRHFDAGATEVVFTQTDLAGPQAREQTWRLLGELAARA